jgi:hypothetical protein
MLLICALLSLSRYVLERQKSQALEKGSGVVGYRLGMDYRYCFWTPIWYSLLFEIVPRGFPSCQKILRQTANGGILKVEREDARNPGVLGKAFAAPAQ